MVSEKTLMSDFLGGLQTHKWASKLSGEGRGWHFSNSSTGSLLRLQTLSLPAAEHANDGDVGLEHSATD